MYSDNLQLGQEIKRPMRTALNLARIGEYTVSPNPMVGAVLIKNGKLVGYGYHLYQGDDHAESKAIDMAGPNAQNSSLYINLEPCAHYGHTPPCVDKVIKAKIAEVHISSVDPNPLVNGKSIAKLREAGIRVFDGELRDEAELLNSRFFHFMRNRRPFVIAKWAMTMDGRIGTSSDSKWISGEESRKHSHFLRNSVDAILIGSKTAITDNPTLNVRAEGLIKTRNPMKFIIGKSSGKLALDCNLFQINPEKTYLVNSLAKQDCLRRIGVNFIEAEDIEDLLKQMGELSITSVLIEGGGYTLSSFLKENLINKFYCYMAPKFIGGQDSILPFSDDIGVKLVSQAKEARICNVQYLGNDLLIQGDFKCSQE